MPTFTATDSISLTRTCNHADHVGERTLPFTAENFYIRPDGTADYWCRGCVRTYNRSRRAAGRVTGRKFGVEIECIVDRGALIRELQARGLRVYDVRYSHQVTTGQWKVVTDASLYNGYELVSPPLKGRRGIADLKKACEALAAAGATVNNTCGLHVHHDVSDLNLAAFGRLFRAWSNNQRNTDQLVARSRRGGRWAMPLRADEVALVEALPSLDTHTVQSHFRYADRYRALNVAAFPRYGTVEVRQHQGTVNFKKIAAWIAFGQAFCSLAKSDAPINAAADTFALIDTLAAHGLAADQATYLRGRATHFTGRQPVAA